MVEVVVNKVGFAEATAQAMVAVVAAIETSRAPPKLLGIPVLYLLLAIPVALLGYLFYKFWPALKRRFAARKGAVPTAASAEERYRIDVNTASVEELQALPGITKARAEAIVAHRTAHGPFASAEELRRVRGIGPATLQEIRDSITAGAATP